MSDSSPIISTSPLSYGSSQTFIVNETIVPITNSQSKTLAVWALGQKNIPNGKQNFTFKEIKENQDGSKEMKRLFFVQKCEDNMLKNVSVVDFSNKKTIQVIQSQSMVMTSLEARPKSTFSSVVASSTVPFSSVYTSSSFMVPLLNRLLSTGVLTMISTISPLTTAL